MTNSRIPADADVVNITLESTQRQQDAIQRALTSQPDLNSALVELFRHQRFVGFIEDKNPKRMRVYTPDREGYFLIQLNPDRMKRAAGAGRTVPPAGCDSTGLSSTTCFICHRNQLWQQRGLQLAFRITVDGTEYFCSCNPFPFGTSHITIASAKHRDQRWTDQADLEHVIRSLVELANRLPGWVVMYNGSLSAGATIPLHRHFQAFKIDPIQRPFPLQRVGRRITESYRPGAKLIRSGDEYPMTAFYITGEAIDIIREASRVGGAWRSLGADASENVVAIADDHGGVELFYVPRDTSSHAPGFHGAIGGLETLGEFILADEQQVRDVQVHGLEYAHLWHVLRSVSPPAVLGLAQAVLS